MTFPAFVPARRVAFHATAAAAARLARLGALALALALAACASLAPTAPTPPASAAPLPRNAEPPPPKVNLSGFPLAYRQGYADGCASATGPQRRDAERFTSDGNYSMGWQDGIAMCRKR